MLLAFQMSERLLRPDAYPTMAAYYDLVLARVRKEVSCVHANSYGLKVRQSARAKPHVALKSPAERARDALLEPAEAKVFPCSLLHRRGGSRSGDSESGMND
jgi:hypothetical protein